MSIISVTEEDKEKQIIKRAKSIHNILFNYLFLLIFMV